MYTSVPRVLKFETVFYITQRVQKPTKNVLGVLRYNIDSKTILRKHSFCVGIGINEIYLCRYLYMNNYYSLRINNINFITEKRKFYIIKSIHYA